MYEQMNMFDFQASAIDREDIIPQGKAILSMDGEVIFYSGFFSK
jgi:hypothetical protein